MSYKDVKLTFDQLFLALYRMSLKLVFMKTWDDRYRSDEFIYGKKVNEFLKAELANVPLGRILFPAEGEGRNAVFAASRGWEVSAFDLSEVGRAKALSFADELNCEIDYQISDVLKYKSDKKFNCIAVCFMHLPSAIHKEAHENLLSLLKPGGIFLLEVFHKEQLPYTSGGPKDLDLLYDEVDLRNDFANMDIRLLEKKETILDEGKLHKGKAIVVRMKAIKK